MRAEAKALTYCALLLSVGVFAVAEGFFSPQGSSGGGAAATPTLQQVTDEGATTTTGISATGANTFGAAGVTTTFTGTANATITDGVIDASGLTAPTDTLTFKSQADDAEIDFDLTTAAQAWIESVSGDDLYLQSGGDDIFFTGQTAPTDSKIQFSFAASSASVKLDNASDVLIFQRNNGTGILRMGMGTSGTCYVDDNIAIGLGNAAANGTGDNQLIHNTDAGGDDHLYIGTATHITVGPSSAIQDYGLTASDGRLVIRSTTLAAGATDEAVWIRHDVTDGEIGTLSGDLSLEPAGNVVIPGIFTRAYGEYHITNANKAASAAITAGTPVEVGGTATAGSSNQFTIATATGGRATYTGSTTHLFEVTAHLSASSTQTGNYVLAYIAVDGTVDAGTEQRRELAASAGDIGAMTVGGIVSLATNSYVEVYVDLEASASDTVTAESLTLYIRQID